MMSAISSKASEGEKIKIAIVGASGYTGRELIRILLAHPCADLIYLSSRKNNKKLLSEVFENIAIEKRKNKNSNLSFCEPKKIDYKKCDLVFFAAPHTTAMKEIPLALEHTKVIDLSADFRIKDVAVWQKCYQTDHLAPNLIKEAVYGLTDVYSKEIAGARLVANPGCYPTSVLLPLIPLIKKNAIEPEIIADCKSGTSGAGAKADLALNLSEIGNNFKMYNAFNHRHNPEILEQLNKTGFQAKLSFTTNLLPIPRGMMSSIYLKKTNRCGGVAKILTDFYQDSPFIQVFDNPASAQIKSVLTTNCCHISVFEQNDKLFIVSCIDNLVKGASGQAVENMNLMFGLDREIGLTKYGIYP